METALQNLLPKMAEPPISFRIMIFQGKKDLLKKLPVRLRGYSSWIPGNYRIIVLIDEDRQDCHDLKTQLDQAAKQAGLSTKSTQSPHEPFQVLNRIVIEELEAWFFGDIDALRAAYPRLPKSLQYRALYRNPDTIPGGTWEALERVLQRAGYFKGGVVKKQAAQAISGYMQPDRNRSKSFQVFYTGIKALLRF